jgi:hypothetical protein
MSGENSSGPPERRVDRFALIDRMAGWLDMLGRVMRCRANDRVLAGAAWTAPIMIAGFMLAPYAAAMRRETL